jgi:hypothetical protein
MWSVLPKTQYKFNNPGRIFSHPLYSDSGAPAHRVAPCTNFCRGRMGSSLCSRYPGYRPALSAGAVNVDEAVVAKLGPADRATLSTAITAIDGFIRRIFGDASVPPVRLGGAGANARLQVTPAPTLAGAAGCTVDR